MEEAMEARTATFYEQHDAAQLVFKRSISSRRLHAHRVADGAKVKGGEPHGTAGGMAPAAQSMAREDDLNV